MLAVMQMQTRIMGSGGDKMYFEKGGKLSCRKCYSNASGNEKWKMVDAARMRRVMTEIILTMMMLIIMFWMIGDDEYCRIRMMMFVVRRDCLLLSLARLVMHTRGRYACEDDHNAENSDQN